MPRSRGAWIAIAVFLSGVILAGFWFLLASPKRSEAADLDAQRAKIESENSVLATKVASLRAEFAKIEDYKAELAALQVHLPTGIGDKEVFDQLTAFAEKNEVEVVSHSADVPTSLLGEIQAEAKEKAAAEEEAAKKKATDEGKVATDSKESAGAAAPQPKAPPEGWAAATADDLVAVPVALEVRGTYEGVRKFVADIHNHGKRYLLVGAPKFTFAEDEGGDELIDAEFTLFSFVFTDKAAELAAALESELDPIEVTFPDGSSNPFGTHKK